MVCEGGSTNWRMFGDVKAQNLGQEKAEYFTSKGTVVFMKKENCMYTVSATAADAFVIFRSNTVSMVQLAKNSPICLANKAAKAINFACYLVSTASLGSSAH